MSATSETCAMRSDVRALTEALSRIGEYLRQPARLVLIGSSVGMWYGQPGRTTMDIDALLSKSTIDRADLAQACKQACIEFDPMEFEEPDTLSLQLVKHADIGKWKGETTMFRAGKLELVHPPAAQIIASKLYRASPADLEDSIFLMSHLKVTVDQVRAAVATMPDDCRELTEENMVYLELHRDILANVSAASQTSRASKTSRAAHA